MGLFQFINKQNIQEGIKQYQNTKDAVLLDVRSIDEYRQGHIPGAKNIPLSQISSIERWIPNKNTPIFVYCLSGSRSQNAVNQMQKKGYLYVQNIGGISKYRGEVTV